MVWRRDGYASKSPCLSSLLLVLLLLLGAAAEGQEQKTRLLRDVVLGSGGHFQMWERDGQPKISEFSIPLVFIWPVSKKLSLDVVSGSGFASLEEDTGSLSGLTDTKVRASYIVGEEAALVTLGVSTPTGKTGLTKEEQAVSGALAQSALNFRTANFGQGLDVNVGVAMARRAGEMVLGLGVGYLLKGEFTPGTGGEDYKPGSELNFTAGLDRKVMDGDGKVTLDAIYTAYSDDEQGGEKAFCSGNKILLQGLVTLKASGLNWRFYAVDRIRGNSTRFTSGLEDEFSNGNQLEAGLVVTKNVSAKLGVKGLLDFKVYADNEFERGEASVISVGPGIRYKLGPGRFIDLSLKYGTGELDGDSASGIEFGGGIWIRL